MSLAIDLTTGIFNSVTLKGGYRGEGTESLRNIYNRSYNTNRALGVRLKT